MDTSFSYDRYQRQLILKGFGASAQGKLSDARVLVIGAGGLGCPVLQYLVAAGVGHIGVADHDRVSVSNLHRQILFGMEDVGEFKVEVVKRKMHSLNPEVDIRIWTEAWTQQHCVEHFAAYDLIVDATDNFSARYMINDAAVLMGKTVVFGAVSQYEGQVSVFNMSREDGNRSVNYRHLFPEPPKDGEVLNCSESGVLGVLPGVIGSVQATEVIKILTGIGKPLANQLWNYNALNQEVFILDLNDQVLKSTAMPNNLDQFLNTDYEELCHLSLLHIQELEVGEWQRSHTGMLLVDIREPHEQPRLNSLASSMQLDFMELPLSQFENDCAVLEGRDLVLICQAGRRSLQAANMLINRQHPGKVYSLKGGVNTLRGLKLI